MRARRFSIAGMLLAVALPAANAAAAGFFRVTVPASTPRVQRVAPGSSGTIVFVADRNAAFTGTGIALVRDEAGNQAAGYEFVGSPAANCGPAQPVVDIYGRPGIGLALTA